MQASTYVKMIAAGVICCVGGPALTIWVMPDPDELFKRYNPELQKKSLEGREQRLKDHEAYLMKLREYSKSNKPIWVVAAEEDKKQAKLAAAERKRLQEELEKQRHEILEEQKRSSA